MQSPVCKFYVNKLLGSQFMKTNAYAAQEVFGLKILPNLELAASATLLCAGITTYDRLAKSDVKYRFVIDMASLKQAA
jgi:hypothetical protein